MNETKLFCISNLWPCFCVLWTRNCCCCISKNSSTQAPAFRCECGIFDSFKRIFTAYGLNFLFLGACFFVSFFPQRSLWCFFFFFLNHDICIRTSAVPVEGEHAACDGHVHWHLSRHPANHEHLLSRVGMESRVVNVLGSPELILSQARSHGTSSEKGQNSVGIFYCKRKFKKAATEH